MNAKEGISAASRVLTLAEVARALGVSVASVRRLISRGEGPPVVRVTPRRLGIREADLERWLLSRTEPRRAPVSMKGGAR